MANLDLLGPWSWVRPFGANAFMPGEEHAWAIGPFSPRSGAVYSVTAHPGRDAAVQALAVDRLSTAYARTGAPAINFVVRNVSTNGVFSYRVFVTVVDF